MEIRVKNRIFDYLKTVRDGRFFMSYLHSCFPRHLKNYFIEVIYTHA